MSETGDSLNKMMLNNGLHQELEACSGLEGYNKVDSLFVKYGFADTTFKDRTSVLYHVMGIGGGGGSPTLTEEDIYNLAKDLLASRVWKQTDCDSCREKAS
ncbi:MAG: hypothetical protein FWD90_03570 [Defluviitaleaceae bacterium]|nr:hypothetical protein [Defluviitaleaceae bacterium]